MIYLNPGQIGHFNVQPGRFFVAADTLLKSAEYDQRTTDLLRPLGGKTVVLEPAPADGPGWFAYRGWLCGPMKVTDQSGAVVAL